MPRTPAHTARLKPITLLLLDVDGVLTDGGIYYTESGEEMKRFHTQDGYGLVKLQKAGVAVALLTGRYSRLVERRAKELGISEVYQNVEDKAQAYAAIKTRLGLTDRQIAYVGDDEPDLQVLRQVGFSAVPADAAKVVRGEVHYVCKQKGGEGAVREVVDLILKARR
ncbi:MAG: HAD-IIIA family hydrolase [Ignavibacterium sp.]|jgi:YrbI family 3-deoxy-D-manno-octulosonate 8-phosphate phosphatase